METGMRASALPILVTLFCSSLYAQTPALEPGTPLRVSARGLVLTGELVRWDADSLVVRPHHAVALSEVLQVERKVPRSRSGGAARGALWGAGVGAVVGTLVLLVDEGCGGGSGCWIRSKEGEVLMGAALFGGLGAGVGALTGAAVPGKRWEPVQLELRISN
jgi:hypothetical protein